MSRVNIVTTRVWDVIDQLPVEILEQEADGQWDTTIIMSIKAGREARLVDKAEKLNKEVFSWIGRPVWKQDSIRMKDSFVQTTYYFIESTEKDLIDRLKAVQIIHDVMST